jgi:nucleoid-associated protein YgaU
MANRYENTKKPRKNKKSYYATTLYSKVSEKNSDMYFIATEGDRCDNLANRFYGDSSLWWFIARVNNLTTNNIPAGTSLRIPVNAQDAQGF